MNASVVISLDTRRAKQDSTYPLLLRVSFENRTVPIPLGYNLAKTDWDEKARRVRKTYQGTETVTRLDNLLQKKKANALDTLMKLDETLPFCARQILSTGG